MHCEWNHQSDMTLSTISNINLICWLKHLSTRIESVIFVSCYHENTRSFLRIVNYKLIYVNSDWSDDALYYDVFFLLQLLICIVCISIWKLTCNIISTYFLFVILFIHCSECFRMRHSYSSVKICILVAIVRSRFVVSILQKYFNFSCMTKF